MNIRDMNLIKIFWHRIWVVDFFFLSTMLCLFHTVVKLVPLAPFFLPPVFQLSSSVPTAII